MIFLTDEDPFICVETLCDQHLLLQIHEVSGILSGVAEAFGVRGPLYGEPVESSIVQWASRDEHNQVWLAAFANCLMEEFIGRFGDRVPPPEFGPIVSCIKLISMLFRCGKEDPQPEVPQVWWECEVPSKLFEKYRSKVSEELLQISCKWTKSQPPYWLKDSGISLRRVGDLILKQ